MSTYPFKCDLCGGVTDAPTYGDFKCQHCGQVYVYDECHRIELSEPQLKALRDCQWITVSERLPDDPDVVLAYRQGFPGVFQCCYEAGQWTDGNVVCGGATRPTHWMPIPEPPEVK